MNISYVLISCEVGAEKSILAELKSLESVKEVSGLFGGYDIIVKLEAMSEEEIKDIVVSKIRNLKKIRTIVVLTVKETQ
ncbi:Lrp/AsnC ligand binding domain-containing protein [Marine Group I thaumarchaeote]|uniref:Lrp/AsnC ligand binding domain-containing protein n=1 Tax=Marine Group I thaumarchaeote TaxID=2511932 RepID=A0A7K4M7W6_9ARCH|nr:MAG: Lrp/AsnC family transcriptional regulator [Nitrosopumilus sp. YT1]NMI82980.1 Lrp/AsnC family transcriptional regulator [Candidatus Nitrosopumilus sp. MTA1]NWJ20144.1 Lrp/AsnC ligand binding domain-containing protein [Marine Group I thaumarchaeote]NWJ28922.1 Lrp/AsnC ligand binding domain-containing protein [Marine Group I thaumarchaeote]NWJ57055.1 Lrp/AsnC ligand binding domain-containing protein [Marine Group I thaumarchaeote]